MVMPEPPAESLAWVHGAAKVKRLAIPVSLLVGITAVSGAFVAGNDAVCNFSFSHTVAFLLVYLMFMTRIDNVSLARAMHTIPFPRWVIPGFQMMS